jgi:hypothetical protein
MSSGEQQDELQIMSCQENLLNRQGDSEIGVNILGICSKNKNKAKSSYKHGY